MRFREALLAFCVAATMQGCVVVVPALGQPVTEASVVVINSDRGKGTGTHIGAGRILTAKHVVEGVTTAIITDRSGTKHEAVVSIADGEVAVLQTLTPLPLPAIPISCRVPGIGEHLSFVGHPMRWTYVHGFVVVASKEFTIPGLSEGVWAVGPAARGQSGSAMRDYRGRIVGILSASMDDDGHVGYVFVVTGASICRAIKQQEK